MKEQNITVIIGDKQFNQRDMSLWMEKRVKKAYKIFGKSIDHNDTLFEMNMKLSDLKARLSDDEIRAILKKKLAISRIMMKMACLFSGGRRRTARTTVLARGITAEKFCEDLDSLMMISTDENRRVNLSVYPEHYVLSPGKYGALEVIETTGNAPFPSQFFITFNDETGLKEERNISYTHQSVGVARLNDGTIIGGVRHQFRNTEEGIECRLAVEFPALSPKSIIRSHQKHLAVEFTNWMNWIIERQK